MNFGVSTASFFPVSTEDTIPIIKELGVDRCEVFLEAESEYDLEFIAILKECCKKNDITPISVHSFCGAFEPFIFSHYERRRLDCIKMFEKVLVAARELGVKYYTFHGEPIREVKDIAGYAAKFTELAEIAKSYGVILAWENVSWCQSSNPNFIEQVMEKIKSDNLKFTLDIKQAYRANRTPADYIKVMGENIVNVHINDCTAEQMCLLPGEGMVDFPKLFQQLKKASYQGDYILEVYRANYNDYNQIKKSLNFLVQASKTAML